VSTREGPAPARTGPESRPATKLPNLDRQGSAPGGQSAPPRPALLAVPLPWAQARIDAAGAPIPAYGSADWAALPDDSRTKIAAVIVAAECWRTSTDPAWLAWRLRAELSHSRDVVDEPAVWPTDVVDQVHRAADRPSFAELSRRRGELEREQRALAHEERMWSVMTRGA
jgi:hypothetical protein